MSIWAYVNGLINVDVAGRTQEEATYILHTVLKHLPRVGGDCLDSVMNVYPIQQAGYNISTSCNEFGQITKECRQHSRHMQSKYIIVVSGDFRYSRKTEIIREFSHWLNRLAKRVRVDDLMVKVTDDISEKAFMFENRHDTYTELYEYPSWAVGNEDGKPSWCEYLMWLTAKESELPIQLEYKYHNNKANDKLVEAWLAENN